MQDRNKFIPPSKAQLYSNCKFSRILDQQPKKAKVDNAQNGVAAHSLAKYCLQANQNPLLFVGQPNKDGIIITSKIAHQVSEYVSYVQDVAKDTNPLVEFDVGAFSTIANTSQKMIIDSLIIINNEIRVIDFKIGIHKVTAENNLQLSMYAIAAYRYALSLDVAVEQIYLTIYQPSINHESTIKWSVDYLLKVEENLKNRYLDENLDCELATANPNPENCRHCLNKATCTAFNRVNVSPDFLIQILTCVDDCGNVSPTMSDAQKLDYYKAAVLLSNHLTKVTGYLKGDVMDYLLANSDCIEGIYIEKTKKNRMWRYPINETLKHLEGLGISKKDTLTLKTPRQIELLLDDQDYMTREKIDTLTTKQHGEPTLKVVGTLNKTKN